MPSELPPEEDRPAVSIAPPLLFVLPIAAALALDWFVPTSIVHGAFRWILGASFFDAGFSARQRERRARVDWVGYPRQASRQASRWETVSSVSSPMLERRKLWPLILP